MFNSYAICAFILQSVQVFPAVMGVEKKVSRFKYATWNVIGLGEKEELDKILNENNIKISLTFTCFKEHRSKQYTES
jgi:hypothetical protein